MTFTKEQVAQGCREFGPILQHYVPQWCDAVRLLWALAGNESSFGADVEPRVEPAYLPGGKYHDRKQEALFAQYGNSGCASHGIFQLMLVNCPGFTPEEFRTSIQANFSAVIGYIRERIFPVGKPGRWPRAYSGFADAYNSGNCQDKIVPEDYIARFYKNLKVEMPADAKGASA